MQAFVSGVLGFLLVAIAVMILVSRNTIFAVLDPAGMIASAQRDLIVITSLMSLIVVIPVFTMLGVIAWRYREGRNTKDYRPDWDGDRLAETIWWGVPFALIVVLAGITWVSSHQLDPFRALDVDTPPRKIEVVALQYKWLFIYPDEGFATVNYVSFPEDTPIEFVITSDAPMNSFWIPQLGGQIYAMSGMSTRLHLMAEKPGQYRGSSANISGENFADMNFIAEARTSEDYQAWTRSSLARSGRLDPDSYAVLAQKGTLKSPQYYGSVDDGLYDSIVNKYQHTHGAHAHDEGVH